MQLRGKSALVMGLGVHGGGVGVARFLAERGARVTVTDLARPEALEGSLAALAGLDIGYVLGEHREQDFARHEIVVQNPGVPRDSRYLAIARAAGATLETEMTLFFRHCPNPANILGITGTKGKTTTTLLAGAMLAAQHPDTVVAGNLQISALAQLPRIGPETPVLLELSSWQLEGLGEAGLSPHYAAVTNLSPDHLNRYASMDDYAEAKKQIFLHQGAGGVAVLNWMDPLVAAFAPEAPGEVVWVAGLGAGPESAEHALVSWGDEILWYDASLEGLARPQRLCSRGDVRMPGTHNLANVAMAAALARRYGVRPEHIRAAVQNFAGVPHRYEPVRELDGVRYINDTAATAPAAALAALEATGGPLVLIAGGADKQLPFDELARAIVDRGATLVLLKGSATPKLQAALAAAEAQALRRIRIEGPFEEFELAIRVARELTEPGATVLLAPGCASFGMFRNEFHRGDEFRRIVRAL
jgi:UDP-N-acetylmuramoylalanine--D-glutamate ligase